MLQQLIGSPKEIKGNVNNINMEVELAACMFCCSNHHDHRSDDPGCFHGSVGDQEFFCQVDGDGNLVSGF